MKKYTLIEAISIINVLFNLETNLLTGIYYEDGTGSTFIIEFPKHKYFVNLADKTCTLLRDL